MSLLNNINLEDIKELAIDAGKLIMEIYGKDLSVISSKHSILRFQS